MSHKIILIKTNQNKGGIKDMTEQKIVVCITAQSNSQRLIDYGAKIAEKVNGSLHILHVQKGNSIFQNGETLKLLAKLFAYGDKCGGMIHALCDENVAKCIADFVKQECVTKVVMGELPAAMSQQLQKNGEENQFEKIISALPKDVEVIIVKRQQKMEQLEKLEEKIG